MCYNEIIEYRAIVFVGKGSANLIVHGNIEKGARIFVSGGGATAFLYGCASRATCVCVSGGGVVMHTRRETPNLHIRGGAAQIKFLWPLSLLKQPYYT